ncbi:MAG: hypothetical protein J6B34_03735 [Clostridia bacterium]|nr:hypothetical protein [Clostridia bacterium]
MKRNKLICILLALCLALVVLTLASCGGNEEPPVDEKADYVIKVADPNGVKISGTVYVEVFKAGESQGMKSLDKTGQVTFSLEKGDYTYTVSPSRGEYYYDEASCTLNAQELSYNTVLYVKANSKNQSTINVIGKDNEGNEIHEDYKASSIGEGYTYVPIDRPYMTYVIFTPTRGGIYSFSCDLKDSGEATDDEIKVGIGYYGGSIHYIFPTNNAEMKEDGSFDIEVPDSGIGTSNTGTTIIILGLHANENTKGSVVKVERTGDPTPIISWENANIDPNAKKADNNLSSTFTAVDIKSPSLKVVFNEADGYYHLNSENGPLLYVKLAFEKGEDTESIRYLPPLLKMCETDNLGKVFVDEDGKIVKKESYNLLFEAYDVLAGSKHLYPLNAQLAEVIKNVGEQKGWFNFNVDSSVSIFGEDLATINKENAWLFGCYYETENARGASETSPVVLTPSEKDEVVEYSVQVPYETREVYLRVNANSTIKIENAQGLKLDANNGTTYSADENGVIEVALTGSQTFKLRTQGPSSDGVTVRFTIVKE